MQFRVLGPLEAVDEGRPVPLGRRRTRALLAYLLLHANEPVSADRLVDDLWPAQPPKTVGASLQNYVSRLRKALGAGLLLSQEGGYLLRVDPERFDLARFERLVAEARQEEPAQRAATLRAALALWRGPALEDLAYEPWAQAEIARLEELRLTALESLFEAEVTLGRDAELVPELEELVAGHPLRERPRAMLMLALYRSGRQADALEVYRTGRALLRSELGLEPSQALRRLERAILEQDPALRRPAAAAVEPPAESRRTVTVLFCDLVESTRLSRDLDPEAYRRLITRYFDAVRSAVERHGGTVEKFIGDAVMAAFGVPELHEDDALRAVRAAVEARAAVEELPVRIALDTGEVLASGLPGQDLFVTGAAVGAAAHLEEAAEPGEILLGEETWRRVRDAVRAERVVQGGLEGWRLEELREGAAPFSRRLDAPLVGRVNELASLRIAYEQARDDRRCRVAVVAGDAGIGKSRLLIELCNSVAADATVLVGRCAPYGEGATYLPLREALLQAAAEPTAEAVATLAAGAEDGERAGRFVAELLGLAEGPPAPAEAFWAVRRLLEALARERPLVLVLEDVHWAEPTLLDLVDYLGAWSAGAPILVLCATRPDLLERRQAWSEAVTIVQVGPLPADDVGALVSRLADTAPDATRTRVVELAGGNPLYAEQLLAAAAEAPDEPLDRAPSSLEALIASRLDRLRPPEQLLLRRAAVIGRRFAVPALAHLVDSTRDVPRGLAALERKGLVHAGQDDVYRFHHALVRDAAYRSLPKAERGPLHERVAAWLDLRADEPDELVGYHLEHAYRCRIEVGDRDEHAQRVATDAGDRLGRAGIRAWRRADVPAAVNLLGRAVALLDPSDERRRNLACELGVALRMRGDFVRAEEVLRDAAAASHEAADRRAELRATIELASLEASRDPAHADELLRLAEAAIPVLEAAGDDRALGRAWVLVGQLKGGLYCRNREAAEAAARAAEHYRSAGWSPALPVSQLGAALFYGPTAVDEALASCTALLEQHADDRASVANILIWAAGLEAMQGEFAAARGQLDEARRVFTELGQLVVVEGACSHLQGLLEWLAGDNDAAEGALRSACETCERLGEWPLLASRAAELGEVLYTQGRADEAEAWSRVSEKHAGDDDLYAQAQWRTLRAKTLARARLFPEAERHAREAIELAAPTDTINLQADALLSLGEVSRLAGRAAEAAAHIERALRLYESKGNVVGAERTKQLLREPAAL